jgi:hypothetical protein
MNQLSMLRSFLAWVQATTIATTIGQSTLMTGFLSALHLLGLTLLVGGALVSSLKLLGVIFPDRPAIDVTGGIHQGMTLGLMLSVATGLLMFAPKAPTAAENGFFQIKMLLLLIAALFHFTVHRRVTRRADVQPRLFRWTGAFGLAIWFGVAAAGCAFILLE